MYLNNNHISNNRPKVAIIVPFREIIVNGPRLLQLRTFIVYMSEYITKFKTKVNKWKIFIAEQSIDGLKFNRGRILNYGAKLAISQGYDTLIFHDVDLLPSHDLVEWYTNKPYYKTAYHIARCWSERYGENLNLGTGGIVSIRSDDFIKVDGYPNVYWGWGNEDGELSQRLKNYGVNMIGPTGKGCITDLEEYTTHKDKVEKLFKINKSIKCSIAYELKEIHKKFRNNLKKPSWWGIKDIGKLNKINVVSKKHFQHFIIHLGLTDNFPILIKTKQGIFKTTLNDTSNINYYIDY